MTKPQPQPTPPTFQPEAGWENPASRRLGMLLRPHAHTLRARKPIGTLIITRLPTETDGPPHESNSATPSTLVVLPMRSAYSEAHLRESFRPVYGQDALRFRFATALRKHGLRFHRRNRFQRQYYNTLTCGLPLGLQVEYAQYPPTPESF